MVRAKPDRFGDASDGTRRKGGGADVEVAGVAAAVVHLDAVVAAGVVGAGVVVGAVAPESARR